MTPTRTTIGLLLLLGWALSAPEASSAQGHRRCEARRQPIALSLAQLTYHEEGNGSLDGAAALYDTIATLAEATGQTWVAALCGYSPRLFRGRTTRAPWILELDGGEAAPREWPSGSSWAHEGPIFAATLAHAELVVSGEVSSPCEVGPTDWGGLPEDGARIRRGERRGWWRRVSCGPNVHGIYLRRCHVAGPSWCADRE